MPNRIPPLCPAVSHPAVLSLRAWDMLTRRWYNLEEFEALLERCKTISVPRGQDRTTGPAATWGVWSFEGGGWGVTILWGREREESQTQVSALCGPRHVHSSMPQQSPAGVNWADKVREDRDGPGLLPVWSQACFSMKGWGRQGGGNEWITPPRYSRKEQPSTGNDGTLGEVPGALTERQDSPTRMPSVRTDRRESSTAATRSVLGGSNTTRTNSNTDVDSLWGRGEALRQQAHREGCGLTWGSVEPESQGSFSARGQQVKGEFAPNLWREGRKLDSVIRRAKIN